MKERFDSYKFVVYTLSFVYFVFGLLKVIGRSPLKSFIIAALPFMQNDVLFGLFGLFEVVLGVGLIFKRSRGYAALAIIVHLLGVFATLLLVTDKVFSPNTIITLEGEFILKDLVFIAIAYFIFKREKDSIKLPNVRFKIS